MPIYSMFKSLIDKRVDILLKNDVSLSGKLVDVDTYSNIKLSNIKIEAHPDDLFIPYKNQDNLFLRGSGIKLLWINESDLHMDRLEDSVRKSVLFKSIVKEEQDNPAQ
ncbi:U6 snRNA-associated Sm-like protein LSm2 [Nematocida sp. LUAm3]|nr:U6 snRNA-associated Sm-like protein LSm2 [Nematocida sp. LUAm3]KAI5174702.1 U6 snRNA-associated Sm-like protein LSm2 [Nematocida sp. LUAm2]KAI5177887.1 U6 snRNA-associated Sm-like protein LSm2 [Nematocida sp. LUAm1]